MPRLAHDWRANGHRRAALLPWMAVLITLSLGPQPARLTAQAPQRPAPGADVITAWNEMGYEVAFAEDGFQTFKGQRALAMMHLAVHDALNTIQPHYERYAYRGEPAPASDALVAAAQAAYEVLIDQYPGERARLQRALDQWIDRGAAGPGRDRGVALGQASASAILALRDGDGLEHAGSYAFQQGPGHYQTTPDWNGFVVHPAFGDVPTLSHAPLQRLHPPPPPRLDGADYARAFAEVKAYGAEASAVRTAEQSLYALWWMEYAEGSVNRLARRLAAERELEMWPAARMFAHLATALFDAYVAVWDAKYAFNHWRPYTAIREAASDGNDATEPDTAWTSLRPAPPFPEYVSAHAAGCAASFSVMASVFGDTVPFTMTTITAPSGMPSRSFRSFSEAAAECADSRVRLGWHFRYATDAGLTLGERIAAHVIDTQLRPR